MNAINPYSTENRYSLDMMGYLLYAKQPRSVRIYSESIEMVKAVVRRLSLDGYRLFVDSNEIHTAIQASLGIELEVAGDEPAEAALVPDSLEGTSLPCERTIVAATRNALSYKSLRYPGTVRTTAIGTLTRVTRQYHVERVVGMYPPRCVALLTLAQLVRRWSEPAYFRLSDLAMQYLYDFGPMWRFCYVVILAGQQQSEYAN